jgi:hypothetical protein
MNNVLLAGQIHTRLLKCFRTQQHGRLLFESDKAIEFPSPARFCYGVSTRQDEDNLTLCNMKACLEATDIKTPVLSFNICHKQIEALNRLLGYSFVDRLNQDGNTHAEVVSKLFRSRLCIILYEFPTREIFMIIAALMASLGYIPFMDEYLVSPDILDFSKCEPNMLLQTYAEYWIKRGEIPDSWGFK